MLPAGQLGQRCTWQVPSSPETRWGDRATCGGGGGVCRCMGLRRWGDRAAFGGGLQVYGAQEGLQTAECEGTADCEVSPWRC